MQNHVGCLGWLDKPIKSQQDGLCSPISAYKYWSVSQTDKENYKQWLISTSILNGGENVKDERNWYRCTTREEMVKLIVAGFNYTNFRKDKFNEGNFTYYFERTKELEDYLASTARVQKKEGI